MIRIKKGKVKIISQEFKLSLEKERFSIFNVVNHIDINTMWDGQTVTGWGNYLSFDQQWNNPAPVYYYFGNTLEISKFRLFQQTNTANPIIYGVKPDGTNILLATPDNTTNGEWKDYIISDNSLFKGFMLLTDKSQIPSEMEVYCKGMQPTNLQLAVKNRPKLRDVTGNNGHPWSFVNPNDPSTISNFKYPIFKNLGNFRIYSSWDYFEYEKDKYSWQYSTQGSWNYDIILNQCKIDEINPLVVLKVIPNWMRLDYPTPPSGKDPLPIPYNANKNLPQTYLATAQLAFQFAARYGTIIIPDNKLKVRTTQNWWDSTVKLSGLNYTNQIEILNETDNWWSETEYLNPKQYAACLSAAYDGHKGTMGNDLGVKAADPNFKIVFAGQAQARTDYVLGVIEWCRENRGYKQDGSIDLPFHAINFHNYFNGATQGGGTNGLCPETSGYKEMVNSYLKIKSLAPSLELYISETGYDRNIGSPIHAISIGTKNIEQVIADWTLRISLMSARLGVDRVYFYELENFNNNSPYGIFQDCGFYHLDDNIQSENYAYPNGNFQIQLFNNFKDYQFDSIIEDTSTLKVDKYVNGSNILYVLWSPTMTDATIQYNLAGLPNQVIEVNFDYNSTISTQTTLNTTNGNLILTVSEKPAFIKI